MKTKGITKIVHSASWLMFLAIMFTFSACTGSASKSDEATGSATADQTETKSTGDSSAPAKMTSTTIKPAAKNEEEKDISVNEPFSAAPGAMFLTPIEILSSTNRGVPKRAKDQPAGVIDFCKVKPYAKYKKQVIAGIAAAQEDYKAGSYGVGFRNKTEYKTWNKTKNDFFLYMFAACRDLAMCEIENKKNKNKNKSSCDIQQIKFDAWQNSAKLFAEQVKLFKTQQPSALCSLQPSHNDVSLCFRKRAEQIDNACDAAPCVTLSRCWTSVAMKDDVIRQAESSCRFSGQKLSKCSGYIGAIENRKTRFNQCNDMQKDLNLSF